MSSTAAWTFDFDMNEGKFRDIARMTGYCKVYTNFNNCRTI